VRRLLPVVLILAAGCSSYASPTEAQLRQIPFAPADPKTVRHRVHLSLDSKWLAGEFDGVVIAEAGIVRAQLFGDLGPKMIDLLARADRILGYFPATREGVDCALPREAVPHPLLFLGATLLEDLAAVDRTRVVGVLESDDGWWLDLKPLVPGMRSEVLLARDGRILERRLRWMYGVSWTETWKKPDQAEIDASGVSIRVRLLGSERVEPRPARAFDLELPADVTLAGGSRK
jgi:hypothetical protein